jgi:hypothetical protein
MVETVSIGIMVAALIAKALNRAEDGAVDAAVEVGRRAVESLRKRLSGDTDAEVILDGLLDAPDSRRREKALADILDTRARESSELLEELMAIVREAEVAGVHLGPIEQVAEGDGNVQNAGIVSSRIEIRQGIGQRSRD